MQIRITATDKLTEIDGVPCRLWEGVSERGVVCKVFVLRVAVHHSLDASQFERELKEMQDPAEATSPIPLRQIL